MQVNRLAPVPDLRTCARAAVAAHVVERVQRTVPLAGHDDRLAVALPDEVVALLGELIGAPDDQPAAEEDLLPFLLVALGIGVHRCVECGRWDVGHQRYPGAVPEGRSPRCGV